jgi:hypothetical protein
VQSHVFLVFFSALPIRMHVAMPSAMNISSELNDGVKIYLQKRFVLGMGFKFYFLWEKSTSQVNILH